MSPKKSFSDHPLYIKKGVTVIKLTEKKYPVITSLITKNSSDILLSYESFKKDIKSNSFINRNKLPTFFVKDDKWAEIISELNYDEYLEDYPRFNVVKKGRRITVYYYGANTPICFLENKKASKEIHDRTKKAHEEKIRKTHS